MTEPILDPDAPFDIFLAPPAQIHINDHDPIYDPCRSYVDEELRQRLCQCKCIGLGELVEKVEFEC